MNDHETRFYKFCLPRVIKSNNDNNNDDEDGGSGSGSMTGEGNDNDHDDRLSEININKESVEPDNTNDDENTEYIATTPKGSNDIISEQQRQQQRCYTLNVHDRWNDGMAIKNRIEWNDDLNEGGNDVDDENENENENPAGYGIRFGMADQYEDFSFPDFGRTASFILCPGIATSSESSGTSTTSTAIVEDYIIVVHTDAPTSYPSDAPSDIPPILLGDYSIPFDYFSTTKKKNFAGKFPASSNLRGGSGDGSGSGQDQGLGVESSSSSQSVGGDTDRNGDIVAFSRRNGRIGIGLLIQDDGDYYP